MPSPYALTLLERIKKKNKHGTVTVDSICEGKTYRASGKITETLKELRAESLISCKSVMVGGKFATELVFEGQVEHNKIPAILRKEEDEEVESKPKRKYTKRSVRRSLV